MVHKKPSWILRHLLHLNILLTITNFQWHAFARNYINISVTILFSDQCTCCLIRQVILAPYVHMFEAIIMEINAKLTPCHKKPLTRPLILTLNGIVNINWFHVLSIQRSEHIQFVRTGIVDSVHAWIEKQSRTSTTYFIFENGKCQCVWCSKDALLFYFKGTPLMSSKSGDKGLE